MYKQPFPTGMCHSDLGLQEALKASTDLQILTTSINILPPGYGEELQAKSTSVNSKTTLSREKVSKDEEHHKNTRFKPQG